MLFCLARTQTHIHTDEHSVNIFARVSCAYAVSINRHSHTYTTAPPYAVCTKQELCSSVRMMGGVRMVYTLRVNAFKFTNTPSVRTRYTRIHTSILYV